MDDLTTVLAQSAIVLVAALIGFLGALIVNRQTLAQAREATERTLAHARVQRRIERAHEMRAEAIPRLFVLLRHVEEQTGWMLNLPGHATERARAIVAEYLEGRLSEDEAEAREEEEVIAPLQRDVDAFQKRLRDFKEYFDLHRFWIPERLEVAFAEVMDAYYAHLQTLVRAVDEWADRGESLWEAGPEDVKALDDFLNQEMEVYEAHVRQTRVWFEGERLWREEALLSDARKILGVEESEDAHE